MKTINAAISAMHVLIERRTEYERINGDIRKLQPDFPQRVQAIDEKIEEAFVALLDEVLGDTLASYYLYDMPKGGGTIIGERRVAFTIKTLDDLQAYAEMNKTASASEGHEK